MKNLIILNNGYIPPISETDHNLQFIDSEFDTVSDSITTVLSSHNLEIIEVQQHMKNGDTKVLATFSLSKFNLKLLSFHHFMDLNKLVFVFDNGDIITAVYESNNPKAKTTIVKLIGTIDAGLLAAKWSPDEEILCIFSKENNLILLSRFLESICEKHLSFDELNISNSNYVSIGWGKEETQFKGKGFKALERERIKGEKRQETIETLGERSEEKEKEEILKIDKDNLKEISNLKDPTINEIEIGILSKFDNKNVKISWRGDGEYFCISTIESALKESTNEYYYRRVIRIFNREGTLDSITEAVDGLEHNLSWKPQGSLIASTQRNLNEIGEESLNLIFFEKIGLRRRKFNTRLNPFNDSIENLEWSSNGEILAFQFKNKIQLWTTKNYHWYLKQEIFINNKDNLNKILSIKFHPEKPLRLMIITSNYGIKVVDLAYKIVTGPTIHGYDIGMTLVTDGSLVKITPLSVSNIPPPLSFREFDISENISDLAISKSNEIYGILTSENKIFLTYLNLEDMKQGKHPKIFNKIELNDYISYELEAPKQIAFICNTIISVVVDGSSYSKIIFFYLSDALNPTSFDSYAMKSKVLILKSQSDFSAVAIETIEGQIFQINENLELIELTKFPHLCCDLELATINNIHESKPIAFGVSFNGKLFANDKQIATAVTSLKVTSSYLLFTNAKSQLCFIHLDSNSGELDYSIFDYNDNNKNKNTLDERIREIEKGSILINIMPSKYAVILEAPRGNFETIYPRMMVLSAVRNFIKQENYKEAFLTCRTHRIDLNFLHDYDPELFINNIENFIIQIDKVEYLDLFLSGLHEENVALTKYIDTSVKKLTDSIKKLNISQDKQQNQSSIKSNFQQGLKRIIKDKEDENILENSKINKICKAILAVLFKPDYFEKYLQTIITNYACQKPPNLEDALKVIGNFKENEKIEQAITHLCYLQDVNKIYKIALSLYDIKLSLLIAQKSQMDPKEYLPFLQNLHILPKLEKEFLIDDYLKNYEKALNSLYEIGEESFSEFDLYVVEHDLYNLALNYYKYDIKRSKDILKLYANYLHDQKNFNESALTYEYLDDYENATENYILCKKWKEAFSLLKLSDSDKFIEYSERLINLLIEDHKYSDAAEIQFYYLDNIEEAIKLYCKNYNYDNAILLSVKEKKLHLIPSIIDVQLNEGFSIIAELLADCRGQINSQLKRLRELRIKKEEDSRSFYENLNYDLDTPDDISIIESETSTTPSFFTRYTDKTSGTAITGVSRRTIKNRKREERKRAKGKKGTIYEEEYLINSVGRLIERLHQTQPDGIKLIEGLIRRNMKEKAYGLQKNWIELNNLISSNIEEIYNINEKDRERINDNGEIYLIPEIPIPKIKEFPKINILDY